MQQNAEETDKTGQPLQTASLLEYLQVIVKRKKLIGKVTLAAAVITAILSLFRPNIYTAKAMILPSQEDRGMLSAMLGQQLGRLGSLTGLSGSGSYLTELYSSMLKSDAVKDPIIDRFKLMELYGKKFRVDTRKVLDKKVAVSIGKKDGIISIEADDKDPKRAAALANAYVDELGRLTVRMNVTSAGQNRLYLQEQLVAAKTELAKAEDTLKSFQAKHKMVQVGTQADATIKGIAEMKAKLVVLEVQLATYRRQLTESSQEVKNTITSIDNIKAQITRLEGGEGDSSIPSVGSVPAIAQEYARIMREYKIQESLVEILTKQYELTRLSEAKDTAPFQVMLAAKVPERKSKPSRALMVLMAAFTAFFFSVVVVLAQDYFGKLPEKTREQWKEVWFSVFPRDIRMFKMQFRK